MTRSPSNPERIILAINATTDESLGWAGNALTESEIRGRLYGNVAIIDERQVIAEAVPTDEVALAPAPQNAEVVVDSAQLSNLPTIDLPDDEGSSGQWQPVMGVSDDYSHGNCGCGSGCGGRDFGDVAQILRHERSSHDAQNRHYDHFGLAPVGGQHPARRGARRC